MEKREDEIYGEGNEEDRKNEEMLLLLALLDYFATLVDRYQDHMGDMAMLLDCNRRCIRNMDHCIIDGLLKNIVKFKFEEFSFASYVESDGSFEEKLQERIRFQKQATKGGRERQKLSFAELYEGFPAFVKTLGSKLSGFPVVYFLRISDGDRKEIERKREAVKNILKMEINLEGKSKIINTLVSVVDFLE